MSKAVVRAAGFLGLSQAALAEVLGVSGATVSRLVGGRYQLQPARRREWEFGLLFVRLYRSLGALVGNDADARIWLRNENLALGARPLELIRGAEGLVRVLHYLDASRGRG
ncbi:MAG TPA: antitoxin Xre/MbcA/ParS toxin-binding domain-containing protein [Steroidobacteraceae bacterium]|nr:antitoxin Xre/MbcA/ParS toxin-binding domain-containing protein [Steroidobacteraceae bacterium]